MLLDEPEVDVFIGAHEGPRYGVPAATVRSWVRRGKLRARGLDNFNRPMYALHQFLALAKEREHAIETRRTGVAA